MFNKVGFFVFSLVVLSFGMPAQARTITVGFGGEEPDDYTTIQGAIDAAVDDDEIVLATTFYLTSNINFKGKAITVRSIDPNDPAIVEGTVVYCDGTAESPRRGFVFQNNETSSSVLLGITVAGAYTPNTELEEGNIQPAGGAIFIRNASPTISKCWFTINGGGMAAGIFSFGNTAAPVIEDCTFTENIGSSGTAFWCSGGSAPVIRRCDFTDNSASSYGGAIVLWSPGAGTVIENCDFAGNISGGDGGAVFTYAVFQNLTIRNSLFTGNTAEQGGAIYCYDGSNITLLNSTLVGNQANTGGAFCCFHHTSLINIYFRSPFINNCILWDNRASNGAQIALLSETPAAAILTVSYSDIQGNQDDVYIEEGSSLIWDPGNVDLDPAFVTAGLWDDSGTPDDTGDDVWIEGDYRLSSSSPLINAGDPDYQDEAEELDFAGNERILHEVIDIGAYEYADSFAYSDLTLTTFTLKAGKTRPTAENAYDSFTVVGQTDLGQDELDASTRLFLRVGDWYHTVDTTLLSGSKGKYTYKRTGAEKVALKLDLGKGTFSVIGKNVDLTGAATPVMVGIRANGFLQETPAAEELVNKKKPSPMQLLIGVENALRVDKYKFTVNETKPDADALTIQGALAVKDTAADLTAADITITWGSYEVTILAQDEDMVRVGEKWSFKYKKPKDAVIPVSSASFDLEKCTFKIAIKKAAIGPQGDPVNFNLAFGDFNESVMVTP